MCFASAFDSCEDTTGVIAGYLRAFLEDGGLYVSGPSGNGDPPLEDRADGAATVTGSAHGAAIGRL